MIFICSVYTATIFLNFLVEQSSKKKKLKKKKNCPGQSLSWHECCFFHCVKLNSAALPNINGMGIVIRAGRKWGSF